MNDTSEDYWYVAADGINRLSLALRFGYGSLIWKVDFPIERKIVGYVKGYLRRFWQGSHDHRGTESHPGRVVTLVPEEEWKERWRELDETAHDGDETICWGVVYKVSADDATRVRSHLDFREKNGYATFNSDVFHPDQIEPIVKNATLYIASTDNHAFLGPKPLNAVKVIAANHPDPHLKDLEDAVRSISRNPDADVDLSDLLHLAKAGPFGLNVSSVTSI
ncbi:Cation transport regulator-like protein 2 [Dinochytrium kinnereticum]|nr:Cation transport regulator-like protein 2 [Dinochytrium kinnereticum]